MSSSTLAAAAALAAELAAIDVATADAAGVDRAFTLARRIEGWAAAVKVAATRRAHELRAVNGGGARVGITTGRLWGRTEASRLQQRTDVLGAAPAVEAVLAEGAITVAHVDAVAAAARITPAVLDHQADLAATAVRTPPDDFAVMCKRMAFLLADDGGAGALQQQRRATHAKRWVDRFTGMYHLSAQYDPERGARLWAALDAGVERDFHSGTDPSLDNDQRTAVALYALATRRTEPIGSRGDGDRGNSQRDSSEHGIAGRGAGEHGIAGRGSPGHGSPGHGSGAPAADGRRTQERGAEGPASSEQAATDRGVGERGVGEPGDGERDAAGTPTGDSTEYPAGRATDRGTGRHSSIGEHSGPGPHGPPDTMVHVHVDLATLVDRLRADSVLEITGGGMLPVETIRKMACDAAIVPYVLNSDGVVLDVGRERRLATRRQRHALHAMYATCAMPGCEVQFAHTTIHHIVPWTQGGPTDLANLVPLCSHHHHDVHEGGWTIQLDPADRTLVVRRPDGAVHAVGRIREQRRCA